MVNSIPDQTRLKSVSDHIQKHFSEELHLEDLARMAGFSKYHFHRVFRETFGETPNAHIRRIRLEQSAFRLLDGEGSITDVAHDCGFSSSQHFARTFKAYFGVPPTRVRQGTGLGDLVFQRLRQLKARPGKMIGLPVEMRSGGAFITLPSKIQTGPASASSLELDVMKMPSSRVASVRTIGHPSQDLFKTPMDTLLAWAVPQGLISGNSLLFGSLVFIPGSKGHMTYDASLTIPSGITADPSSGVRIHDLEKGEYGVRHERFQTHDEAICAIMHLSFGWWASGFFPAKPRPIHLIFYNDPAIHPARTWLVDICLPITTAPIPSGRGKF